MNDRKEPKRCPHCGKLPTVSAFDFCLVAVCDSCEWPIGEAPEDSAPYYRASGNTRTEALSRWDDCVEDYEITVTDEQNEF